jgi:tetratricopeptide (TPR) repeat protein
MDASTQSVNPSTTIAILLGASAWPNSPGFQASPAFINAAQGLKKYLLSPSGFDLPVANFFDQFDTPISTSDQLEMLGSFLEKRIQEQKQAQQPIRDVLVYFVGHGGFAGAAADFYLLPRRANASSLRASGMSIDALAEVLREKARRTRQYLLLDCCFSAAAFSSFQGGADQVALLKIVDAFHVSGKSSSFPQKGTTLLCSSDQKSPSLLLLDESCTMFSFALLEALKQGNVYRPERLSLRDLRELAQGQLDSLDNKNAPRPGLHSPDQSEGDVADVPLFPNPSFRPRDTYQDEPREAKPKPTTRKAAPKEEEAPPVETAAGPLSETDLVRLFRAGVAAKAAHDLEQAAKLWQQVLDADPNFGNNTLAPEMEKLEKELHPLRVQRARQRAEEFHIAGTWVDELEAWQVLAALEPNDREAKERIKIAGNNQKYVWMYLSAEQDVRENKTESAKLQLDMLWKNAPDYGDPAGLAPELGMPTHLNYAQKQIAATHEKERNEIAAQQVIAAQRDAEIVELRRSTRRVRNKKLAKWVSLILVAGGGGVGLEMLLKPDVPLLKQNAFIGTGIGVIAGWIVALVVVWPLILLIKVMAYNYRWTSTPNNLHRVARGIYLYTFLSITEGIVFTYTNYQVMASISSFLSVASLICGLVAIAFAPEKTQKHKWLTRLLLLGVITTIFYPFFYRIFNIGSITRE